LDRLAVSAFIQVTSTLDHGLLWIDLGVLILFLVFSGSGALRKNYSLGFLLPRVLQLVVILYVVRIPQVILPSILFEVSSIFVLVVPAIAIQIIWTLIPLFFRSVSINY